MKENILGYKVNTFSVHECVKGIFTSLKAGHRTWLACFNPHSYVMALHDKVFSLRRSGFFGQRTGIYKCKTAQG